jgi:hypothetical protein
MDNAPLKLNQSGGLDQFTFPGGYTLSYLTRGGDTLCPECAEKWVKTSWNWNDDGSEAFIKNEEPIIAYIHWEGGPESCADCSKELPSEYGATGCDQCEALMINGVFCHEQGCPNHGREATT